jgi:hypothetical protein
MSLSRIADERLYNKLQIVQKQPLFEPIRGHRGKIVEEVSIRGQPIRLSLGGQKE